MKRLFFSLVCFWSVLSAPLALAAPGVSALAPVHTRSGLDAEVVAWRGAIIAAASTVSDSTVTAVNQLVLGLKSNGLWSKCYMIDVCAGDDLTAALIRLKVPAGVARSYKNNNFVSADYSEASGLTGNGSTKYLNTDLNPVSLGWSTSSVSLWAYMRVVPSSAGSSRPIFGSGSQATSNSTGLGWFNGGTQNTGFAAVTGVTQYPAGGASRKVGFIGASNNGSRAGEYYENGVKIGSSGPTGTGSFLNYGIGVYALIIDISGARIGYDNATASTKILAQGFSASEALTLYNLVQAFETALGRNV